MQVQSPSLDSGDEGSLRLERGTYSYMFQDIVSIKTMLLKLKRVLQEVMYIGQLFTSQSALRHSALSWKLYIFKERITVHCLSLSCLVLSFEFKC